MSIVHVIAHHLFGNEEGQVKLRLRSDELSIDENKEELLDKLKSSFLSRINRKHGSFSTNDTQAFLVDALKKYQDNALSFPDLSNQFMQSLEKSVGEKKIAVNSHFLFFIVKSGKQEVFYLFVTTRGEAMNISDDLEVAPSYFIDTGVSLFGVKVDLSAWRDHPNSAYVTIIPPRGKPELSESFHTLCGFNNVIDKEEATLSFLKGVESYAEQLPQEQAKDYRTKVVEYCMEQEGKDEPVSIIGLSENLNGIDVEKFVKQMLPHNPVGSDEAIMLDKKSLRQYVKFFGRDRDLSISFSSNELNGRVGYDAHNDILSIHGLPKSLRNQLLKHLSE